MNNQSPIVTLTTDFGLTDEYVGVLKGVILSKYRNITTVDISHNIKPQDIQAASHLLSRSYSYFPESTVHLVVVDPGVGSSRQIIAVKAFNHFFVGPDNGMFSFLFKESGQAVVYRVNLDKWGDEHTSNSFHGRDIMAPVAAQLANSQNLVDVGEEISVNSCVKLAIKSTSRTESSIVGEVVHVDRFGNLCTNIHRVELDALACHHLRVVIKKTLIESISVSYSEKKPGSCLALYDSHDFLEIAINQGNASEILIAGLGSKVVAACIYKATAAQQDKC